MRVGYSDVQVRMGPGGYEIYMTNRLKVLKPEGLAIGNITNTWNPSTDDLTVNELKILRGGQVIDVLQSTKFQVIQRENQLEYSMLDGALTANLQIPGLQVGDEIELAATIRRQSAIFEGRSFNMTVFPPNASQGVYRFRLVWSDPQSPQWKLSPDLGQPVLSQHGPQHELTSELMNPKSVVVADDAPARLNVRRLIEFSGFSSWAEVSNLLSPLFDKASTLTSGSAARAEVAKIAASTTDPIARAEAALTLVQDRVRYVYVGMNGGNYRPATADETWSRRFGDCKAKTALLLALLHELGIKAEAVLVSSTGGDGADQRLPTPEVFDHVLVRATIGSRNYWLDGTRLGDTRLDSLRALTSRWGLPIRSGHADLEAIPAQPVDLPLVSVVWDIDARAGFDTPAKVRAERVLHGDDARQLANQLSALSADDLRRAIEGAWRQSDNWIEPEKVGWRYEGSRNALVLTLGGHAKLDWTGDDREGRTYQIPGAGFTPPSEMHRPKEQDQTAPWLTDFPGFRRWTTIVRLPPETRRWRWSYSAAPVHELLGGVLFWRQAVLKDGVIRTTMSRRTLTPEVTAAEAQAVNDRLPKFDNNISQVFQVAVGVAPSAGEQATPAEPAAPSVKAAAAVKDQAHAEEVLGEAAVKASRLQDALAHFNAALHLEPENVGTFRERADVLDSLGLRQEALSDLDEAWRIDPLDPVTIAARAREAAAAPARRASNLSYEPWDDPATVAVVASPKDQPETAEDYVNDGTAFARQGQPDKALAAFDQAISLKPDYAEAYVGRGVVYRDKRDFDRGISDLTRAIELKPDYAEAYYGRGFAYAFRHLCSKAIDDYSHALRLNENLAPIYYSRGACYADLGLSEKAMEDFDKTIALNPQFPGVYNMVGAYYAGRQQYAKAADALSRAVAMDPKDAQSLKVLADVEEQLGHRDEAIADFRALLKLKPAMNEAKEGLARLHAAP